ncbi:MAG: sigma-70 family RNA polymerase sigma factor [Planctomycetes bacterium]|nr:sigma-70 family RNA polymerase sigma factor [Planctomycetota bacterium]
MDTSTDSAHTLVERWQSGDQSAAAELYQRYASRLWHLAERQLDDRLKRRVDGEDVVQSAMGSFFARAGKNGYSIADSSELMYLLVRITLNKVRTQAGHHRAQKRDVGVENALAADELAESLAEDPVDSHAAALLEEVEIALRGFEERDVEIVRLTLEGFSATEVAARVECSQSTVRRVMDRLGSRLKKRLSEDSAE